MAEKEILSPDGPNGNFDRSWRDEQWDSRKLSVAAHDVAMEEKEMTVLEAIRANPKAIFWSLVISTCVIMEGYDTNLLGNFFAYRELRVSISAGKVLSTTDPFQQQPSKKNTATESPLPSRPRVAISWFVFPRIPA